MKQRVLVVDDSPFIRRILSDWIKAEPDFEVVGTAANGQEAVALTKELRPDLITLDVEMPVMDGLAALEIVMKQMPTPVIMVSSLTTQGAQATLKALELGALDFIPKPQGSNSLRFLTAREDFLAKLRTCRHSRVGASRPAAPAAKPPAVRFRTDKVVLIASSTGGPKALAALFAALPKGFPAPILVVQHMPEGFTASFAKRLDGLGTVPCKEAAPNDTVVPGLALIAPGGRHMRIASGGKITFDEEPPIHGVRPAADHLFESGVEQYGRRCVGVVLTGMGKDGAQGAVAIRSVGGYVLGESADTATVYGMPKAAMAAGGVDLELPLDKLGSALVGVLEGRLAHAS